MKRVSVFFLGALPLALGLASIATARQVGVVASPLVDHPVVSPTHVRTSGVWKKRLGAWGEGFAEQTLRLSGYPEVYEFKTGSDGGIDRVAIKRAANGAIENVKFLEVKTTCGTKFQLAKTKYGGQVMSRKWLAENLKTIRRSGEPAMKKLALEISRFIKASGRSIEDFGEVTHINTQAGKVTVYKADGKTKIGPFSIERLLKDIQKKASAKAARRWATRALASLDQIKAGRMLAWLDQTAAFGFGPSRRIAARTILARAAGPIAVMVALAIEAKEFADVEMAYRHGLISLRQRNISHIRKIGGLSGFFAGGAAGAWLGALGGPLAGITVPVGAVVGAAIGGIGGYFAGSTVAGYAATEWYRSIDSTVRERFELQWVSLPVPLSSPVCRQ